MAVEVVIDLAHSSAALEHWLAVAGEEEHSWMVEGVVVEHLKRVAVVVEEQLLRAEGELMMEAAEDLKACVMLGEELEVSFQLVEAALVTMLMSWVSVTHFHPFYGG